jgi:hypothetical protein
VSGRTLIGVATLASVALVGVHIGAGGRDFTVATPGDPCQTRQWREGADLQDELVRSAFDGAACRLKLPRAEVALALTDEDERARLARERGLDDGAIGEAVRAGARRAIDDAEGADAIGGLEAFALRALVSAVPPDQLLSALRELAGQ